MKQNTKRQWRKPKRINCFLIPNRQFGGKIRNLFSMAPLKITQEELLPNCGGIVLLTDSDGVYHPSLADHIRSHAKRLCSTSQKSALANKIALRRTGIETSPSPHGKRTKTYLFEHDQTLKVARELAVAELPFCDIRFVVEEDGTSRKLLKNLVEMELNAQEWERQFAPQSEKEIRRAIGNARN